MNNRKYIIIFGTLILLLVFIAGAITYYNERKEQANIFENLQIRGINIFPEEYPTNLKEFSDFMKFCKIGLFAGIEEFKNEEIKKGACVLVKVREDSPYYVHVPPNSYKPVFTLLDYVISLRYGQYVGISVDLKDVVRKYNPALLEEDKLYFCSISKPSWADPFYLQMEPKQDLIFNEGDVSCGGIKMDKTPSMSLSGFIPRAESLNIKKYLVDEQTVSDVMNKESFSEIKEILNDYPIIWQMEKPISF